jgi:hypothetical protein
MAYVVCHRAESGGGGVGEVAVDGVGVGEVAVVGERLCKKHYGL